MDFVRRHQPWSSLAAIIVLLIGGYLFFVTPPRDFPRGEMIGVHRGASVSEVAGELSHAGVIRSSLALETILRISGSSSRVHAGTYLFEAPEDVFSVAHRLTTGAFGLPPVRVTFPEGVSSRDIAEKISAALPLISKEEVLVLAKAQEGYLFPDTYLFPPDATAESVLKAMRENFDTKTAELQGEVQTSGHSLAEIVTMASILEKEVRTDVNRRIVSGILWSRLAKGMMLQVDAVFGYIYDRDTYSPSYADLTIDSPYNTYKYRGLPPGPISNPGLSSLKAALNPTKTSYLFYLTDKEGVMHYATTYSAHQANEQKYLR